jgi:phosphoribosylamine---glycine ligase
MKILLIGSGGREHALAWKLAQSSRVSEVLVAPGNAGTYTETKCRNIDIAVNNLAVLLECAMAENVAFTVVGRYCRFISCAGLENIWANASGCTIGRQQSLC